MDINDYKPNSHKYREEQKQLVNAPKKAEKVINGKAKRKRKSEASKLKDIFISEDVNNVKSYVFMDVLVPAIKKAISDIVTDGIDMILYGESGKGRRKSSADKVSYRNYYDRDRRDDRGRDSHRAVRSRYEHDDVILESKGEAEKILDGLGDMIDRYGVASVGDLYDMADLDHNYTDNSYGWTSIRNAKIVRVRDGYLIDMPKALPID